MILVKISIVIKIVCKNPRSMILSIVSQVNIYFLKLLWMSGKILREVRRKRRLWKKAKNGLGRKEYNMAAKRVKNLIRNFKRSLEKKLAADKYQNNKPFYSYIKKKITSKVAVCLLLNEKVEMVSEKEEIAEELKVYFASVFTREDTAEVLEPAVRPTRLKLSGSGITTEKVKRKIMDLKLKVQPGQTASIQDS